jgi:hypothetical protein
MSRRMAGQPNVGGTCKDVTDDVNVMATNVSPFFCRGLLSL